MSRAFIYILNLLWNIYTYAYADICIHKYIYKYIYIYIQGVLELLAQTSHINRK